MPWIVTFITILALGEAWIIVEQFKKIKSLEKKAREAAEILIGKPKEKIVYKERPSFWRLKG